MGNSLFDQLKKTGLIDTKKANKSKKEKHKLTKQHKGKVPQSLSESKLRVQQTQTKKSERDRKLNRQQGGVQKTKRNHCPDKTTHRNKSY